MFEAFTLEPKTVFMLYFWANLFICVLIYIYILSYAVDGTKGILMKFACGKLLLTTGWVFIFFRNMAPDFISINIANTFIVTACYFESDAMLSLLKHKSVLILRIQIFITSLVITLFHILVFVHSSINTRIIVLSVGIFAIYLLPTIQYFRAKGNSFFRRFYAICFAIFEILVFFKAAYGFFINPQRYFFSYTVFENLYNISLFLLTLIGTVGFLLLVKENQNSEIQKLLEDKNQFFSIIAHDLRGPLGSSVHLSSIVVENIDQYKLDEIKDVMKLLHESNENIYKLLNNLLQWSKVQTGLIEYQQSCILLNDAVENNIELFKNAAQNKDIDIILDCNERITVKADKNMLDVVLRNLLTNALKFTPKKGKVTVAIQVFNDEALVSVSDTGIGMSALIKQQLFKINSKIVQKGTDNELGNGLGLLLCSEFVRRNRGKIWVESEPGQGSIFNFSLPLWK